MINIEITGSKSKQKNFLYNEALKYYLSILLPRQKSLLIDLSLDKNLFLADAFCTQIESRYFIIELSTHLPFEEQLKALAHEMVHCKQYIKKELVYKNKKVLWKKKIYDVDGFATRHDIVNSYSQYLKFPWEQEAYILEDELFNSFEKLYKNEINRICEKDNKRRAKVISKLLQPANFGIIIDG